MDCSSITDFQQSTAISIAKKFRNLHIGFKSKINYFLLFCCNFAHKSSTSLELDNSQLSHSYKQQSSSFSHKVFVSFHIVCQSYAEEQVYSMISTFWDHFQIQYNVFWQPINYFSETVTSFVIFYTSCCDTVQNGALTGLPVLRSHRHRWLD